MKSNFVHSPLVGLFFFFSEKNPVYRDSNSRPNVSEGYEVTSELPGRPVLHFQHAHFIPIVGVGKRDAYELVHGDLPMQHPFGTTLRFTGPAPADSRQ